MINLVDKVLRKFGYKVSKNVNYVTFSLHQTYESVGDTEMYMCNECRHNEFFVGQGSCYTAVMCIKCGHEECVHDG